MPGKVNPVIPEVVSQAAFWVIGNDVTITIAAEAGQLELNAFEPVMLSRLFESITCLTNAIYTLTVNCIMGITANEKHCAELMEQSVCAATALCPYLGYKKSAEIAKESLANNVSVDLLDKILDPYSMRNYEKQKSHIISSVIVPITAIAVSLEAPPGMKHRANMGALWRYTASSHDEHKKIADSHKGFRYFYYIL